MIQAAVFGAGAMGSVHAHDAAGLPDVQVKYICTPAPDSGGELAKKIGARLVHDPETVYQDPEVDLIVLAYPTHVRRAVIEPALAAGKYVFCEKPLAHTMDEAKKIVELEAKSKTWVSLGMVVRYFWEYRTVREMVQSGRLGNTGTVRVTRACTFPKGYKNWFADFESSGGVILDLSLHDIDFLCWTFGPVERVYAKGMLTSGQKDRDYALVTLRFASGVIAQVEGSWIEQPGTFYTFLEVCCEKGMIEYDSRKVRPVAFTPLKAEAGKAPGVVVPEIPVLEPPYRVELRAVVEAIRSGGSAPIPARDAFAGVEAAHAAITSIRTGQPVTLQGKGGNR